MFSFGTPKSVQSQPNPTLQKQKQSPGQLLQKFNTGSPGRRREEIAGDSWLQEKSWELITYRLCSPFSRAVFDRQKDSPRLSCKFMGPPSGVLPPSSNRNCSLIKPRLSVAAGQLLSLKHRLREAQGHRRRDGWGVLAEPAQRGGLGGQRRRLPVSTTGV